MVVKIAAHIQLENEFVADPVPFPDHHVDRHVQSEKNRNNKAGVYLDMEMHRVSAPCH